MSDKKYLSFSQSLSFTLASIIGTGIFTSLGYQLESIHDLGWIFVLWILGGLMAFCGALSYASLGTNIPGNGGEVLYLTELLHPSLGYISAWVSLVAGFAAPAAASALTVGAYLEFFIPRIPAQVSASALILLLTALHAMSIPLSGKSQKLLTYSKLSIMCFFVVLCLWMGNQTPGKHDFFSRIPEWNMYGVSLLYVLYAYSGWNSFGYFAGHIADPGKKIPLLALVTVLVVFVLYLLINIAFLKAAPLEYLSGYPEAGARAADYLLGTRYGSWMSALLGILLISSTSAFVFTGPRVFSTRHPHLSFPRFLTSVNQEGIPLNAILLQGMLSLLFVFFSNIRFILAYTGFSLSFFTLLSVFATLLPSVRKGKGFRVPLTPFTQGLFILVHLMIYGLAFSVIKKEIIFFIILLGFGFLMYFFSARSRKLWMVGIVLLCHACTSSPTKEQPEQKNLALPASDTSGKRMRDEKEKNAVEDCTHHAPVDSLAEFIAGTGSGYAGLKNHGSYVKFCLRMNERWKKLDSFPLKKMQEFSRTEISPRTGSSYVLFYPFAGADFLYADVFFPECSKMVLCALEPSGHLPDMNMFLKNPDSLNNYLRQLEQSLYAILKFSFFKTKSMRLDFHSGELNGVVHLLLYFIKRRGYVMEEMYYFSGDSTGKVIQEKPVKSDGIYFRLCKKGIRKEVFYYRGNISNMYWKKHRYKIKGLLGKEYCTFIKSASYLLHEGHFSDLRKDILQESYLILQDESGIPFSYIDTLRWKIFLYGSYQGPIKLFSKFRQKQLDSAYRKVNPRPLGFGIGYNYKDKNSCFMLFVKK